MAVRRRLKWAAKIWGIRLKAYVSIIIGLVGFGLIAYGSWSAYQTYQATGGAIGLNSSEYLPELVAWDMMTIFAGAAIVLFASR